MIRRARLRLCLLAFNAAELCYAIADWCDPDAPPATITFKLNGRKP